MALVRYQLGKGAFHFSNKSCSNSLLHIEERKPQTTGCALSFSAYSWSGNGKNTKDITAGRVLNGSPSREVTAAAPPDPACLPAELPSGGTTADHHGDHREKEGSRFKSVENNPLYPYAAASTLTGGIYNRVSELQSSNWNWNKLKFSGMSWAQRLPGGRQGLPPLLTRAYRSTSSSTNSTGEPLYRTKTGYYQVLQVSPNATHAQIKTAYYKQSFIYHPDKNAGSEEATLRFSDISEAYNVLGNKGLKKKYDHGILSQSDLVGAPRPPDRSTRPPSMEHHSVKAAQSHKVFDFDHYIKSHYDGQLQRQRELRERQKEMLRKKDSTIHEWRFDTMMEIAVGVLVGVAAALVFSLKRGH